jgi:hypothetical protein
MAGISSSCVKGHLGSYQCWLMGLVVCCCRLVLQPEVLCQVGQPLVEVEEVFP